MADLDLALARSTALFDEHGPPGAAPEQAAHRHTNDIAALPCHDAHLDAGSASQRDVHPSARRDRLREARVRDPDRSLDRFDFDFNKKMNRALIHELATARFLLQREDVLLLGPPVGAHRRRWMGGNAQGGSAFSAASSFSRMARQPAYSSRR